jgi:hypothetical protein
LRVLSARTGARRLVVGLTGPAVRSVAVRVGAHEVRVATDRPGDPEGALDAGVPAGLRWFIAGRGLGASAAPARASALGADGRRVGPPVLDCGLDLEGGACRRAYEEAALGRLQRARRAADRH